MGTFGYFQAALGIPFQRPNLNFNLRLKDMERNLLQLAVALNAAGDAEDRLGVVAVDVSHQLRLADLQQIGNLITVRDDDQLVHRDVLVAQTAGVEERQELLEDAERDVLDLLMLGF